MVDSRYIFDILNEKTDFSIFIKWILGDSDENVIPGLGRSEFALHFLNYLQEQTASSIQCSSDNYFFKKDDTSNNSKVQQATNSIRSSNNFVAKKNSSTGYIRKTQSSPSDKLASIKRLAPQPCNSVQNNFPRHGMVFMPGTQYQGVPVTNTSPMPNCLLDFGYNVPYAGGQSSPNFQGNRSNCPPNFSPSGFPNNFQINQFNCAPGVIPPNASNNFVSNLQNVYYGNNIALPVSPIHNSNRLHCSSNGIPVSPSSNLLSTYNTGSNNKANSVSPISPQFYTNNNVPNFVNPGHSPFKSERVSPQTVSKDSPSPQNKSFQTPKAPKSHKSSETIGTPNSNSSSSGISLLSPNSPSYMENFPPMGSSNERKPRHDQPNNSKSDNCDNQSNKQNKKRIKPTMLYKNSLNFSPEGEFGNELKTPKNNVSPNVPDSFPKRKQNFFKDEKFTNQKRTNMKTKSNADINPSIELLTIMKKCDATLVTIDKAVDEVNDISFESKESCKSDDISEVIDETKVLDVDKSDHNLITLENTKNIVIDPSKVKYIRYLSKLVDIYCAVLDANLIPNVTAEVYFIFSLLTVSKVNICNEKESNCEPQRTVSNDIASDSCSEIDVKTEKLNIKEDCLEEVNDNVQLFYDVHQIVYFACHVLAKQKHILEILDKTTLKLLMQNTRLLMFVPYLIDYLKELCDKKKKEPRNCNYTSQLDKELSINPVMFQMELDNRDTFSAESSFHIFRKQRDSLYDILQLWNEEHHRPNWNFSLLAGKVEKLFLMSADPVNMRHLARHFCDLLLKSVKPVNIETEEYSISGMPEIDKSKLSRLTERLTRPSPSYGQKDPRPSPDFPGLQAFYRDFLVVPSAHYSFHTHFINCLTERIHLLNATSFQFEEPDLDNGQMVQEETRCAFLLCLRSLCVLAKFLGLVVFFPYQSSSELPQSVLQDEIITRNKVLPPLDLNSYVSVAQEEGRLVQTIPWIVEYLGMMDNTAPHLSYYQSVLNTLFSLYLNTAPHSVNCFKIVEETNFHLLSAVQAQEIDNVESKPLGSSRKKITYTLSKQTSVLLRLALGWLFDASNFSQSIFFNMASHYKEDHFRLEAIQEKKWHNITFDSSDIVDEKLLQEFCPYLINLRLCLSKNASDKQGPVRHITPVPSQSTMASCNVVAATTLELQLEENFFMGQSESLRRTVDFVAERVASACIKNICSNVIVSLKHQIYQRRGEQKKVSLQHYVDKYYQSVQTEIENGINQRLNIALSALLGPDVMDQSVNKICQEIAARKLQERVVNWLQSHINISEILTKLQTNNSTQYETNSSSQIEIINSNKDVMTPSEALIILQDLLSDVLDSRGMEGVKSPPEMIALFHKLTDTIRNLSNNIVTIQIILSLVLDYILLIVTYHPDVLTESVLEEFCVLWKLFDNSGPLTRLLSPRNIMLLVQGCFSHSNGWNKFGRLIVHVVTNGLLSIADLEAQVVAFFRYNWPEGILKSMSKCLREILNDVCKHRSCANDPKLILMLELCSEMASDIHNGFDDVYQ